LVRSLAAGSIRSRVAKTGHRLRMQGGARVRKAAIIRVTEDLSTLLPRR